MSRTWMSRSLPAFPSCLAACALLAGGATSCRRVEAPSVVVTITEPKDGTAARTGDDVDPRTPGIQIRIVAVVTGAEDGTLATLLNDARGQEPPWTAKIAGGQAIFPAYSLSERPDGNNRITVQVRNDGGKQGSATIHVYAGMNGPPFAGLFRDEGSGEELALSSVSLDGPNPTNPNNACTEYPSCFPLIGFRANAHQELRPLRIDRYDRRLHELVVHPECPTCIDKCLLGTPPLHYLRFACSRGDGSRQVFHRVSDDVPSTLVDAYLAQVRLPDGVRDLSCGDVEQSEESGDASGQWIEIHVRGRRMEVSHCAAEGGFFCYEYAGAFDASALRHTANPVEPDADVAPGGPCTLELRVLGDENFHISGSCPAPLGRSSEVSMACRPKGRRQR